MKNHIAIVSVALCLAACGGSQGSTTSTTSTAAEPSREPEHRATETLSAGLVTPGTPAPELMIEDQDGRVRQLSDHRGHPVVLYFYPRDATPGCTAEACAFRDAWTRLEGAGAIVLGVSTDDAESHRRFREEHELPFDLLADVDARVAHEYGVPVRDGMSSRVTFLIDGTGVVHRVFEDVDPALHANEVIAAIDMMVLDGS
ncbi:MAG: peroxiredoxin [Myxococcota bacterium]|nr:peroxiredoxin [Myxococcota bacterium]